MRVDRVNALIKTFLGDSWVSRFLLTKADAENSSEGSAHPIPPSLTSAPLRLCARPPHPNPNPNPISISISISISIQTMI
jgi:hypothetical protein